LPKAPLSVPMEQLSERDETPVFKGKNNGLCSAAQQTIQRHLKTHSARFNRHRHRHHQLLQRSWSLAAYLAKLANLRTTTSTTASLLSSRLQDLEARRYDVAEERLSASLKAASLRHGRRRKTHVKQNSLGSSLPGSTKIYRIRKAFYQLPFQR